MILIDSHCHIHDADFWLAPADFLREARKNNVDQMITIGTDLANSLLAKNFAAEHDEVFWTLGWHPQIDTCPENNTGLDLRRQIARELEQFHTENPKLFADEKLVAIGEIGLDYHYAPYSRENQIFLLENMLQIAQDRHLPVSFHVREAFDDFWPIFDNFRLPASVLHSFTDSRKNLNECLKRGLYIGTNGLSTYADLPHPPLENIVLETDAPYLAPRPFRGQKNQPAHIKNIADWAAEYYDASVEQVAKITTANARKIFNL